AGAAARSGTAPGGRWRRSASRSPTEQGMPDTRAGWGQQRTLKGSTPMSSAPEHARRRSRARPQGRFARALHWLRWPVVLGWLAVVILIHPFAAALSGVTNDSAS